MRFRNASAKNERKPKRTFYASIGFLGILLAAGIIFTVLMLNSSLASPITDIANISPRSIASGPVNLSENHTKSSIDASGTPIQLRTKKVTITERIAAAERFRALYRSVKPGNGLHSAAGPHSKGMHGQKKECPPLNPGGASGF